VIGLYISSKFPIGFFVSATDLLLVTCFYQQLIAH
jgi:hypothetical protein